MSCSGQFISHAECAAVHVKQRFLFLDLGRLSRAHAYKGADHLDVEASALRFGINVGHIVRDSLALFMQSLNSFHDRAQPISSDAANVVSGKRESIRHHMALSGKAPTSRRGILGTEQATRAARWRNISRRSSS